MEALAAGEDPPAPGPLPDEVRDARKNVELLGAAISVLNRQESEARTRIGMELAKGLRPDFAREWEGLALAAVAFSEAAARVEGLYDLLRGAQIPYASSLPVAAPLGWADGRDKDSRLNRFISEVAEEYGLSIPRKVLDQAEERRLAAHMREEARKKAEKAAQERAWAAARSGKKKVKAEHDGFVKVG